MEEAMLRASDSFFLCHLFQVVVVLGVLAGSEGENGDSKSGDRMARVAERAEEPAKRSERRQPQRRGGGEVSNTRGSPQNGLHLTEAWSADSVEASKKTRSLLFSSATRAHPFQVRGSERASSCFNAPRHPLSSLIFAHSMILL